MAEEAQDPIEAVLSSDEAVDQTVETEGTDESPEVEETTEQDGEAQEQDAQDEEVAEETETDAETEPEVEQPTEEELDPKEEARRRYEERQRYNQERRERLQAQTQDYVQGAEDDVDQRVRAIEVQEYARTIENNENKLIGEFDRVKSNPNLQLFNPENKEQFNERLYEKALRDYNAGYLGYDENGNLLEVKGSLFEHFKETAELFQGAERSGQVKQVRATQKMRSVSDSKPAAQQRESTADPVLDILKSDD
jgi:hypothetical protein